MIRRVKKGFRWLLTIKLLTVTVFVLVASYTKVPTAPTSEDQTVFTGLGFEAQVSLIRKIQHGVFDKAPLGDGIPDYESREPEDLMKFGQGLCFDRSCTFDKAFHYVGLESRHMYIVQE